MLRLPRTLYSLFWSMFGLVNINSVEIKYPSKDQHNMYAYSFPGGDHATSVVEGVGMFLFALYHVAIIIVLINMLIAMMSHSFEDIQVNALLTVQRILGICPRAVAPKRFPRKTNAP